MSLQFQRKEMVKRWFYISTKHLTFGQVVTHSAMLDYQLELYAERLTRKGGLIAMTKNQIAYATLLEDRRANRENEAIARERNATTRELGFADLAETSRHNVESERHNVALLEETSRANRARENETRRANLAAESETNRANLAREQYNLQSLGEQIRANRERETQARLSLYEQQRANLARESETYRSNVARETEMNRSNTASERERQRANFEQERLESQRIQETKRHNVAQEKLQGSSISLGYAELNEKTRSNRISEQLQAQRNETEATRIAVTAAETERSNREREQLQREQLGLDRLKLGQSGQRIQIDQSYLDLETTWRPFDSFARGVNSIAGAAQRISPFLSN